VNRRAACAVIAVIVVLLSGCGSPDLADDAATRLQADVLAVSRSSAAGHLPAARAALGTLTQHVASAQADGDLSATRANQITASIDLVSADLTALEQAAAASAAARTAATKAAAQAAADVARNSYDSKNKHHKDPKNHD
jgi:hypothetical protein